MIKARTVNIISCLTFILNMSINFVSADQEYTYATIYYPGSLSTDIYGINDLGQIVGEYQLGIDHDEDGIIDFYEYHGFLYEKGNYTTIDYPGANYLSSNARINNIGQIVGRYMPTPGDEHGFIYNGSVFTTIDYLSYGTALRGINDFGQIVGRASGVGGFLYEEGVFTLIKGSNPRDINNYGQIVGENGVQFGFFEDGTTFTTIEYPGSVVRTEAAGINDAGTIVGYYMDTNPSIIRHGFIYSDGTYSTLDYPGATYTFLYDINNLGQIVANIILNGQSLGALIVPIAHEVTIEEILIFFDKSVSDGALTGDGTGKSANERLNALRNMLEEASDLIAVGDIDGVCGQLKSASMKCDGYSPPPDFVTGEALTELYNMIVELMAELGCE